MKKTALSDGEWKLMNLLWARSPREIAELTAALRDDTGWSKATVNIMLGRLAEKGAVEARPGGRAKQYSPLLSREEAAARETDAFLARVFGGRAGHMVAFLAGRGALTWEDVDEIYAVLLNTEKEDR